MLHVYAWTCLVRCSISIVFGLLVCADPGWQANSEFSHTSSAMSQPRRLRELKAPLNPSHTLATLLLRLPLRSSRAAGSDQAVSRRWTYRDKLARLRQPSQYRSRQIHCSEEQETEQVPLKAPLPPPPVDAESAPTPNRTFSSGWSGSGRFADGDSLPLSFWLLGPNPRRAILPTILIWGVIAPAVNLFGSGSFLASLFPEFAQQQRLDTFYPVSERRGFPYDQGFLDYSSGFKRYVDSIDATFEFRYPATYVQDQTVYLQNLDRAYAERTMDPQRVLSSPRKYRNGLVVAFGPARQAGEENLSVVAGSVEPGFTLKGVFGSPTDGAQRLVQSTIAKEGVRDVTLLDAFERRSAKSGRPLYQFEYRVDFPGQGKEPVYVVCVVGVSKDTLFTFASRVPSAAWQERADSLREAANSFMLP